MIMPEPLTAACGQRGKYVELRTVACCSEWVNVFKKSQETLSQKLLHS